MKQLLLLLLPLLLALLAGGRVPVDATEFLPLAWMVEGEQIGGEFAYAVAAGGDVNGDGYEDVAVGAARYQLNVYREGVVSVYYGSPGGLRAAPNWSAGSGQTGARFGSALAFPGDVNGDGYGELLVGASDYNNGTTKAGAAFLFYGTPYGLEPTPRWAVVSNEGGSNYGYAVSGAGDVDGDGFDDLLVGARWHSGDDGHEGSAYLYYGAASGAAGEAGWEAVGGQAGAGFGSAVAGAGDVDGDGYDDVAVGAPYFDTGTDEAGAVFLFPGGPQGAAATPAWRAVGGQTGTGFGSSMAAGDENGDGYDDLLVGAQTHTGELPEEGAAFLYTGSPAGLPARPTWQALGGQEYSGFGSAVSSGDINGDGYDDLLIGASLYTDDQAREGTIFLFQGGPSGPANNPFWHGSGDKAETAFGFSATAGDIDGDGFDDVVVGAPLYRQGEIIVGRAFAYLGGEGGSSAVLIPHYLPLVLH